MFDIIEVRCNHEDSRGICSVQTCLYHRLNVIGIVVSFPAEKHLLVIIRINKGTEVGRLGSQESKAEFPEYERMVTDALPRSVILRYWPLHPERILPELILITCLY